MPTNNKRIIYTTFEYVYGVRLVDESFRLMYRDNANVPRKFFKPLTKNKYETPQIAQAALDNYVETLKTKIPYKIKKEVVGKWSEILKKEKSDSLN